MCTKQLLVGIELNVPARQLQKLKELENVEDIISYYVDGGSYFATEK